jgi:hypothetical protein
MRFARLFSRTHHINTINSNFPLNAVQNVSLLCKLSKKVVGADDAQTGNEGDFSGSGPWHTIPARNQIGSQGNHDTGGPPARPIRD